MKLPSLTVKKKLIGFMLLAVIMLLSVAGTGVFFDRRNKSVNQVKEGLLLFLQKIFEVRVAEKTYLQFRTETDKNNFNASIQSMQQMLTGLRQKEVLPGWQEQLARISPEFVSYQTLSKELLDHEGQKRDLEKEMALPLEQAETMLDEIIKAINERQAILQMQGADLSGPERDLKIVVKDTRIIFLQLQKIQYQYIGSGEEQLIQKFKSLASANTASSIRALEDYAKALDNPLCIEKAKKINQAYGTFLGLVDQLLKIEEEKRKKVEILDSNGGKLVKTCEELSIQTNQHLLHQQKTAAMVLTIIVFSGLVGFAVIAVTMIYSITRAVDRIMGFAGKLTMGDLSADLQTGADEFGKIGLALNTVVEALKEKVVIAAAISEGNLRRKVRVASEDDSLGKALDKMLHSLNNMVAQLLTAAEQVDVGSNQVASSSQTLSQGAVEQISSLEEIVSSISDISSRTKTNAENAGQANRLVAQAREAAREGVDQMTAMTAAMTAINSSSQEISKIIKSIDAIAFQTNLLALNAAVEAARAGKHGKGFAVVAQEVRNLAARSAKAAQETTELIEAAVKKAQDGNMIVDKTGEVLQKINQGITKVADLMEKIADASNEQAQGLSQVSQGISQIDGVSQQNSANAQETSASAEELSSQAARMRAILNAFHINRQADVQASPAPLFAADSPNRPKLAIGPGKAQNSLFGSSYNP